MIREREREEGIRGAPTFSKRRWRDEMENAGMRAGVRKVLVGI